MRTPQWVAVLGLTVLIGCASPSVREPLHLSVVSQRTILEVEEPDFRPEAFEMSLSPDGRHLLFTKIAETGTKSAEEPLFQREPYLLDTASGEVTKLPFDPLPGNISLTAWMTRTFTSDGRYIHAWQAERQTVLYDIANRTERVIEEPDCRNIISDESASDLYVTSSASRLSLWGGWSDNDFRVAIIPIKGGKTERFPLTGILQLATNRNRVVVYSRTREGAAYSVQDLPNKRTLFSFPVHPTEDLEAIFYVFWTLDGRYLCFPDKGWIDRDSTGQATDTGDVMRVWDSVTNETHTFGNCVGIAPGPGPHLALALDSAAFRDLAVIVVDIRNGWRWPVPVTHRHRFICASGKYVVYRRYVRETPDKTKMQIILVELGVATEP